MLTGSPSGVDALLTALDDSGASVATYATDRMYADPFWTARFGARGRVRSDEDARYHLQYLKTAVQGADPKLFEHYACWLRDVLVPRGMCSRHLAQHLGFMREAIALRIGPMAAPAVGILHRGELSLAYAAGPQAALGKLAAAIVVRVVTAIKDARPEWQAHFEERGAVRLDEHVLLLLSYLADSVAASRPDLFEGYSTFMGTFLEARMWPSELWTDLLREVSAAIGEVLDDTDREPVLAVLSSAVRKGRPAS